MTVQEFIADKLREREAYENQYLLFRSDLEKWVSEFSELQNSRSQNQVISDELKATESGPVYLEDLPKATRIQTIKAALKMAKMARICPEFCADPNRCNHIYI